MPNAGLRFTSADLESFPDGDGKRYEVIDGELYVSKQPSWYHQMVCLLLGSKLIIWNGRTAAGQVNAAPGLIFAEDDDVAPDLVWCSRETLAAALGADGKLHAAPELVVEALSPGSTNERRDRDAKLKLYSRRGVIEYWIVDWQTHRIEVYRRQGLALRLVATLRDEDALTSPLLAGFELRLAELFADVPRG